MARRLPLFLFVGLFLLVPSYADDAETIRVRLLEQHQPRVVELVSAGGSLAFFADGQRSDAIARLEKGDTVQIGLRNGQIYLDGLADVAALETVQIASSDGARFQLRALEGADAPPARVYEGGLTITQDPQDPGTLQLVNEVALEAYVASVLTREYAFDEPEGAKAMAVVVRTYALFNRDQSAGAYDLYDNTEAQTYEGALEPAAAVLEAVAQTEGQILTHRNQIIEAVHFAASGGHTASNEDVWGGPPRPYLRGRPDPYAMPEDAWRLALGRDDLLPMLSDEYGFSVSGLRIRERSPDGRVATLEVMSAERDPLLVSGSDFRLLLDYRFGPGTLQSTLFEMERQGERFVFQGRGDGHGVGVPRQSVREQARLGRTYTDILAFYYTDIALSGTDVDVAMPLPSPPLAAGRPVRLEVEAAEPDDAPRTANADEETDAEVLRRTRFKPNTERKGW